MSLIVVYKDGSVQTLCNEIGRIRLDNISAVEVFNV